MVRRQTAGEAPGREPSAVGSRDQHLGDREVRERIEETYRCESRAVLATLIRLLGDFDRAEEALHEAFRAALEKWPGEGLPENPRAWLISAGRFRSIDQRRRDARFEAYDPHAHDVAADDRAAPEERLDAGGFADDRLRLIFTCCHPALAPEARIALTLREVCGLTTEQIAHAFLTPAPTLAQRIVRAKAKIRDAAIPYEVPGRAQLPERLDSVLRVIYLVFNEGYTASSGPELMRLDLASEAIRLGRLLLEMLPEPEAVGLLALMLLQDSRRAARASAAGELIVLEEQDRTRWDRGQIEEGSELVSRALGSRRFGPYALQAAIAAIHCQAMRAADTDWREIVALYDLLRRIEPTPVVELNRAVAIAMRDGPSAGLALVDELLARGDLVEYRLAHAARADLCRRLGRAAEARAAYERALALTVQGPEKQYLARRLAALGAD
ncbi:MAG: RNA polymerase sigma factor [Steroidobacteraceae bacterium]